MYEAFFGLAERPFQLTANQRFLVLNPAHREALATLRYGFSSSLGITLLLGEAGTGKTTLLRAALHAEERPDHRFVVLSNPTLSPSDFYEILADKLGLAHASSSKGRFLLAFERDLLERHKAGGLTAIVIDEAQSLSHELFEEVRLLANLETEDAKLLSVVLVGQQELADRLNDPSLRQLKQRIVLRCVLPPLDLASTASYIAARLGVAGASPGDVFMREAVVAIYEASRGIPRIIGVICENALLAGFAAQTKPIGSAVVADVCRDLDLGVIGPSPGEDDPLADYGVAAQARPARASQARRIQADEDPQALSEPEAEARTESTVRLRRPARRFWLPTRSNEPASAAAPEAAAADDRPRMFRFF